MSVKARMACSNVNDFGGHREVFFNAAYSADKSSPNYSFSQATPQASLRMVITNRAAFEQFVPGKTYDLVFTEFVDLPKS
ncbi:hypothetical protein [Reyranella sp.]|uniref:hypothetical protein n=1 Tax=Reyranella sp. TaxID=1929291 RepID=UPI003C7B362C